MKNRYVVWLFAISIIFCTSCGSTKKAYKEMVYFRDITDSLVMSAPAAFDQSFQPGDLLDISVYTTNEKMSAILNPSMAAAAGTGAAGGSSKSYLVDNDSAIAFPLLGHIRVAGHTRSTLTAELTERLRYHVDSPIVSIRLSNYQVTVLGEVARPGTLVIPNERVTILDAIGLAGDLTMYGFRDSIRVIRRTNGKVESGTLNLNSGDIFQSPFFYLKQNDVVYVKMTRRKLATADQASLRSVSIIVGIVSAAAALTATIVSITR